MGRPKTKPNTTMIKIRNPAKMELKKNAKKKNSSMLDLLDMLIGGGNKKGQLSDLAIFMVGIFSIAVLVSVTWVASDAISEGFRNGGFNDTSGIYGPDANNIIDGIEDIGQAGDTIFSIVIFGLTLALLLSAVLIPTNIVFMVVYLLGVLFIWMVSPIIANTYNALVESGSLATAAADLTVTDTIMKNFPIYMTFLVFIVLIILFAKGRLGSE